MTKYKYAVGDRVIWTDELITDWFAGRAAVGCATIPPAGTIVERSGNQTYCGLCDHHARPCPGPWYSVDFWNDGAADAYGEHELLPTHGGAA